jgi:hypothetical protein
MGNDESTPPPPERRRRGFWSRARRMIMGTWARGEKPKIDLDPDIVMAALFAMLLLLGGLVGLTLYQQGRISSQQTSINKAQRDVKENQDRLDHQQAMLAYLEKRDRINSYQTAYRFCARINVDRAAVHDLYSYELPAFSRGQMTSRVRRFIRNYVARLEDRGGLPILDCEPNVSGGPAKYQSPREQRKFVVRWRRYRLTPAELGICRIRIGTLEDPRRCAN